MKISKYKRVIVTMKEDISTYPPIISLFNILRDLNVDIIFIGGCHNEGVKDSLVELGVKIYATKTYSGNFFKRLVRQLQYKRIVKLLLNKEYTTDSLLWMVHLETVILLGKLVENYNSVGHFLELRDPRLSLGYKIITLWRNYKKDVRNLDFVICCEYNRAHITKAIFQLKRLPYVMPNKPFFSEALINSLENDFVRMLKTKYSEKKIVLYQGGFEPERNLDDFVSAINKLPDDFVLFLMGGNTLYYNSLKAKFESDKIVFIPYLYPPSHLEITKLAYIGILSYHPQPTDIGTILNALYCAPNKLYEYSRYNIPMISNDVPALKMAFDEFHAGICVDLSVGDSGIVSSVLKIDSNYSSFSAESNRLYESVNIENVITEIVC